MCDPNAAEVSSFTTRELDVCTLKSFAHEGLSIQSKNVIGTLSCIHVSIAILRLTKV